MPKRSTYARIPKLPSGWVTHSCPSWRALPFNLLEPSEKLFLQRIVSRPLFSQAEFLDLLHECFGDLISSLSDDSLSRNLYSGECYADREFYDFEGVFLGAIRVFCLGLVVAVPMPAQGTRFKLWYCFPSMTPPFRLLPTNFVRPFPPHDVFAGWCFSRFRDGLPAGVLHDVSPTHRKIPLWDGSGSHVSDQCYLLSVNGREEYLWFEIHTGAEKYNEQYFFPRLLSAERFCKSRGRYVVVLPFRRDLDTAQRAIRQYNSQAKTDASKPLLDLSICQLVTYHGLAGFKESLGFYDHQTTV